MAHGTIEQSFEALTFGLQGELFAIDAGLVREILDVIPVTGVPGARSFVNGLINVRGKVIPLADLRVKFDMEQPENSIDTRFVVVEIDSGGEAVTVGLVAEKVHEVVEIDGRSIEKTPDLGMRWRPEFVKGIGKNNGRFIIIPDLDRIFSTQ
jgi:purine-binding chemotaxis protein CheW